MLGKHTERLCGAFKNIVVETQLVTNGSILCVVFGCSSSVFQCIPKAFLDASSPENGYVAAAETGKPASTLTCARLQIFIDSQCVIIF